MIHVWTAVFITDRPQTLSQGYFAGCVDQYQTAQNLQADRESTLSNKEMFFSKNCNYETAIFVFIPLILKFQVCYFAG